MIKAYIIIIDFTSLISALPVSGDFVLVALLIAFLAASTLVSHASGRDSLRAQGSSPSILWQSQPKSDRSRVRIALHQQIGQARSPGRDAEAPQAAQGPGAPGSGERLSITGVRITRGDAVACPQIRDDAGRIHTVSYLSPLAGIGARVTVTGSIGYSIKCIGKVFLVMEESIYNN
jgi:hypothetical protein